MYLDVNQVPSLPFFATNTAWDAKQCDVQSIKPSPSGKTLAYCVDGSGYETYDVRLKDMDSGEELDEAITDTAGSIAWAGDASLFYTRADKAHQPCRCPRYRRPSHRLFGANTGAQALPSVAASDGHSPGAGRQGL